MMIAELILKILLVVLAFPAGYLLLSTIAAFFFKKESTVENRFLNIGVLIPAHNEESGIGQAIADIFASNYPTEKITIFVVADNCTDRTAEKARSAGAFVFERFDTINRGKGQALDWFLKNYKEKYQHTDAVTVIDADVAADRNYLREISASLSQPGIQVIQGYSGVSNPDAGWRPALIDAAFNVFNHLRMAGSVKLSGTTGLKGIGMAFHTELLAQYGWPCHSIVEDLEFTLMLLEDGISVHFNPDAIVRSEMVTAGKNAESQRSRWEGGRFMLVRKMTAPLFRLFAKTKDLRYLYAFAELTVPPLSLLVILFTLASAGTLLLLHGSWVMLALSFWLILLFYVASGQLQRHAPLSTWLYLVAAPLYILWKIPLYLAMLFKKSSSEWVRTARESEQNKS
jgi:1,2-diacylglycerol 3-beta-glucosyltransferase